jgi:RNA polymerase sigma-70 factor (ECF subfamily)
VTGSEESFAPLLAYYASVTTLLRRFGFSREDAEDLTQEVFLHAYANRNDYRGDSRWSHLKSIAWRVVANNSRYRHAAKRFPSAVAVDLDSLPAPDAADPAISELRARLRAAVDELEPSVRAPIVLQLQGLSISEIAAALRLTEATVKSRLHTARVRLRQRLSESSSPRAESLPHRVREPSLGRSDYDKASRVLRSADPETQVDDDRTATEGTEPLWAFAVSQLHALNELVSTMRASIHRTLDAERGA